MWEKTTIPHLKIIYYLAIVLIPFLMKSRPGYICCLSACLCLSLNLSAQKTVTYYGQTFKLDTLYPATGSTGMTTPWHAVYRPDDSLSATPPPAYKLLDTHSGHIATLHHSARPN